MPEQYEALLGAKIEPLLPQFAALGAGPAEVFMSPPHSFRMRAEFRVWHDDEKLQFVMFDKQEPRKPVVIDNFPIASPIIQEKFPQLRLALTSNPELRHRLFQIEFLSTLTGELLVTLIYHRKLHESWETAALGLQAQLGISIIGRSKGQKVSMARDWVEETLRVGTESYQYKQPEQAFTQPNALVNQSMITWAVNQITAPKNPETDLLELYCGIGNFTIPLARKFRRVLATEVSKVATRAAIDNLAANDVTNVEFARLSAEEVTEALAGVREFRRLKALEHSLDDYNLQTVFVDPPRAGLDEGTLQLVSKFQEILYISCNPLTLIENLKTLDSTHVITSLAFFDQFPYTEHLECGVHLRRRNTNETTQ